MKKLVVLVLVLALAVVDTHATMAGHRNTKCPVCESVFLGSFLMSYSDGSSRHRDYSDSMRFLSARPTTCPYCLYTAEDAGWAGLSLLEVNTLRRQMADLPIVVSREEAKTLQALPRTNFAWSSDVYRENLAARTGRLRRKKNAVGAADLAFVLHRSTRYMNVGTLRNAHRKELLQALAALKEADFVQRFSQYQFQYLQAEFLRLDRQPDEADRQFQSLIERIDKDMPKRGNLSGDWDGGMHDETLAGIRDFAVDGRLRIALLKQSPERLEAMIGDRILEGEKIGDQMRAIEALMLRGTSADWAVVGRFCMRDRGHFEWLSQRFFLDADELRKDPKFSLWVLRTIALAQVEHERQGGALGGTGGAFLFWNRHLGIALNNGRPLTAVDPKKWKAVLEDDVAGRVSGVTGTQLRKPIVKQYWVGRLAQLMETGDALAIAAFLKWAPDLDRVDSVKYRVDWATAAILKLARAPRADVKTAMESAVRPEKGLALDCWRCVAYLGDPEQHRKALLYLAASENGLSRRLAFAGLAGRGDRSAVKIAVRQLAVDSGFMGPQGKYLKAVATSEDLELLRTSCKAQFKSRMAVGVKSDYGKDSRRMKMEELMVQIGLRLALEEAISARLGIARK